jgi:hypothetical protein
MALQNLCAGMSLLGLVGSAAIAPTFNDSVEAASVKTFERVELLFTCEDSLPLLSVRWDDGDNTNAADIASAFLNAPFVTPRVITDKAKELAPLTDEATNCLGFWTRPPDHREPTALQRPTPPTSSQSP